jgi:4-alpha-glucanotransferase
MGLDDKSRINKPSTVGTNWRWRLNKNELNKDLSKLISEITLRYGRMNY